jgi:hypothetical protein
VAFANFVGEAAAYLGGVSAYFYVQETVPSNTDAEIRQICHAMGAAGPPLAPELAAALDAHRRTVLGIFGRRVPQMVLAHDVPDTRRGDILASGLIAEAFSNAGHRDFRDVLVGLARHYECARRLSLDITDVFDAAAGFADADTATLMRIFGRRSDVTLGRFGWREVETPNGPAFESA